MLIILVCFAAGILLIGYLLLGQSSVDREWSPSEPEPTAKIIFSGEWGQDIGLHRATNREDDDFNYGFSNFYVKNDVVYIADTINEHVSAFTNSKLVRMYLYSTDIPRDTGLVATEGFLYVLDDRGYISKIDSNSGAYVLRKQAIEAPNGFLTENEYTMYTIDRLLVINDSLYANTCVSPDDLSRKACPFVNLTDPDLRKQFVYLPGNYFASISNDEVFLHDANGREVGRVAGIDEQDVQYDIRRNYQVELNGVYYLKRSDKGAEIYFRPWQK